MHFGGADIAFTFSVSFEIMKIAMFSFATILGAHAIKIKFFSGVCIYKFISSLYQLSCQCMEKFLEK